MPSRGSILVIMNRFQGYETLIPDALRDIGFDAAWVDARPSNGMFVKILIRLGVWQWIRPLSRLNVKRILSMARGQSPDTLVLISPENLGAEEMQQLRAGLPGVRIVLYLWDSSANRSLEQSMIDAADAAFSFDLDDSRSYKNLTYLALFHSHERFYPARPQKQAARFDFWFVGTARLRRVRLLSRISRLTTSKGGSYFFHLSAPSILQLVFFRLCAVLVGFSGVISRHGISKEQYLKTLNDAGCVIDVEQRHQNGLTMRTMEAVFAGSPLATSNRSIVETELYHHFPITVFSERDLAISVPQPRQTSESEVLFHRYHVNAWLENLLQDRDVQAAVVDAPTDASTAESQAK